MKPGNPSKNETGTPSESSYNKKKKISSPKRKSTDKDDNDSEIGSPEKIPRKGNNSYKNYYNFT